MRLARTLLTTALLCIAAFATAGTMHPAVELMLNDAAQDDYVSVLVHMAEQAPIPMLNEELKLDRATRARRHVEVIGALQSVTHFQDDLKLYLDARMEAGTVQGYTSYWISNLLVVSATKAEIEQITARADVFWVEMNFVAELIEPVSRPGMDQGNAGEERSGDRGIGVTNALRACRAPEVWYGLGLKGAGTLIGSMDTGVMGSHIALTDRWRGNNHPWQECWLDVLGGGTQYPSDGNGHGTHTTGTMTGVAEDDTVGMAWEGEWIACNAINQGVGSPFDNDVIAGFQWFADPDGDPGTLDDVPDVVQNSWGVYEGLSYPDCFSLWWDVIDNCEAAGVVTTWSAGNEGYSGLRSPADRATSLYNCYSVGSVNATDYGWPYPISSFSSRGPSTCPGVPADNLIKPEVVAPGSNVYSSTNDGGFQGGWNGTSMAGPHVAGLVALMRQANPNLDVDLIKQIIIETARDEGPAGEDNDYGHGFIDAEAAVLASMSGFGTLEGYVTNGSFGNLPLQGASVELIESGNQYFTDASGFYSGLAAPEDYTARASLPGFAPLDIPVSILVDGITAQDFALTDIAGPSISGVSEPGTTTDTVGPYPISAEVDDPSTIVSVKLFYRLNQGSWAETAMTNLRGTYSGSLPGVPANTQIDYYVWAEDGVALTAVEPFGAPNNFFTLYVTEEFYAYQAEDPGDPAWTMGVAGDAATSGIWERVDPIGTNYEGTIVQPEDDHTADPGIKCFITGNGSVGGAAGEDDVDGGCTTLLSPVFDLTGKEMAFVKYWRWYGEAGFSSDDEFEIYASDDAGATWTSLETVADGTSSWDQVVLPLHGLIELNGQVQFRFLACDLGDGGLVEAGIDDFGIDVFTPTLSAAGDWPTQANSKSILRQNQPNPFHPGKGVTTIQFNLAQQANASLQVFDISGRLVRTLLSGPVAAGEQAISWNGKDDQGSTLGSGVYFYRLQAGKQVESRRMILVR